MSAIATAIIGFLGVLVGSILSPWLTARIEIARAKAGARRALIDEAREYVSGKSFGVNNFSSKHFYLSLAPELDSNLIRTIEGFESSTFDDPVKAREDVRRRILNELAKIERKWGLI